MLPLLTLLFLFKSIISEDIHNYLKILFNDLYLELCYTTREDYYFSDGLYSITQLGSL